MEERKAEIIRGIQAHGITIDPQWLDRVEGPAPLWVIIEALLDVIKRLEDPPNRPFD